MSCWVVPSLAAEYLGISIEELYERLRIGALPSKDDSGFVFVDVAPGAPTIQMAEPRPTFVDITAEELSALTDEEDVSDAVPITSAPGWVDAREFSCQLRRRPAA
ncbi:MAG TPA: hypothetical protein VG722_02185 [Tepidisphaeraceae bacterium]|nr:hypothetical protein [Tepidisphaeraceae bacterium]